MDNLLGFFSALVNPDFPFVRNALVAGLLSSILFGVIGAVVTVKRIAGLAGAISHAVLGGHSYIALSQWQSPVLAFPLQYVSRLLRFP